MIRTTMTMLAVGLLTLSGVSAMAATKATHHAQKTSVVAQADGAPAADAAKPAKKAKGKGKSKGKEKTEMKDGKTSEKAPGAETAAPSAAPIK